MSGATALLVKKGCCETPVANVWKLDGSGNVDWSWSSSNYIGTIYCISTDGESCWVGGIGSNTWDGTDGSNANVWKLDSNGNVFWHWGSGGTIYGITNDGENCYVVGFRSSNWEGTDGSSATVWKLDSSGVVVWSYDTASICCTSVTVDDNYCVVGAESGPILIYKISKASGSLVAATGSIAGVNVYGVDCVSGGYICSNDAYIVKLNSDITEQTYVFNLGTNNFNRTRVAVSGDTCLCGRWRDSSWQIPDPYATVFEISINHDDLYANWEEYGIWCWDSGAYINGVSFDGGNRIAGGYRSNAWGGTDGSHASVWKFDSNGNVIWHWDSGDTSYIDAILGVATDGVSSWVCGYTSDAWER